MATAKKKRGRLPKEGSKKKGDLSPGECRYTFIADITQIRELKDEAENLEITMKELMYSIIDQYLNNVDLSYERVIDNLERLKSKPE